MHVKIYTWSASDANALSVLIWYRLVPVDQWKREVFRQFLNVMSDISLDHTASDCTQSDNNSKDYKAHHSNRLVNLLISNLDTYSTDVRSLFKSTCSMLREANDTSQKNNRNSLRASLNWPISNEGRSVVRVSLTTETVLRWE